MFRKKQAPVVAALKERTTAGRRRIAKERVADHRETAQDDKKLQLQMKRRAKELYTECTEKAALAADKGELQTRVCLELWASEKNSKQCQYLTRHACELLEKAGFAVKIEYDEMKPVGSDPLFSETVYSTYLLISWDT